MRWRSRSSRGGWFLLQCNLEYLNWGWGAAGWQKREQRQRESCLPSAAPAASAEGAKCGVSNCLDEILSCHLWCVWIWCRWWITSGGMEEIWIATANATYWDRQVYCPVCSASIIQVSLCLAVIVFFRLTLCVTCTLSPSLSLCLSLRRCSGSWCWGYGIT